MLNQLRWNLDYPTLLKHDERGVFMHIGEPLRTIVVEPLELPVGDPTPEPNPVPVEPETEPVLEPATV